MHFKNRVPALLALGFALSGCVLYTDDTPVPEGPPQAGGALTVFDASSASFSTPAPHLSASELALHDLGDKGFDANFVAAPAPVNAGLGPLFNNTSCAACHVNDGRGRPPESGGPLVSMLFRISQAGQDSHGGPNPLPGYGGQLQTRATFGNLAEASVSISYRDSAVHLTDTTVSLRIPTYALQNPWSPFTATPLISPRVAPSVFGLGLLEAVSETDILSRSDAADGNGDGISGRANSVYDVRQGRNVLGRFGWKAGSPTLEQQSAGAYNQDMGVTNILFKAENCEGDLISCAAHPVDVDSVTLEAVVFYMQSLGVPGRRQWNNPQVQKGEKLFASIGCTACHVPDLRTGAVPGQANLSGQIIHPYTDLLIHDMGPGLSDNRPDYTATGNEWRTAPLWGIGLTQVVNGHTLFLHDGRARNFLEAILWHGGEGDKSRKAAAGLIPSDRAALIAFLQSL